MPAARPPLILLPPSETKWSPERGKPIDLESLVFPELTDLRRGLLDNELRAAPATTAARLYTGVLYAALDIPSLPAGAAKHIVVISAQFGALRMTDRVPAYKREMDAAYWRDGLRPPLDALTKGRVMLDCRSHLRNGLETGWHRRSQPRPRRCGRGEERRAQGRQPLRQEGPG